MPVIVLSARHDEATKVAGPRRRRRRLRHQAVRHGRAAGPAAGAVRRGAPTGPTRPSSTRPLRHRPGGQAGTVDGADVHLTPTEWGVVEVLVRNRGKLVPQRQLLQEVWGPARTTRPTYLRVYMAACAASSSPTRPGRATSSPRPGWAIASTRSRVQLAPMSEALPSATEIGVLLPGFRIERQIGQGGMSVVYLAEDLGPLQRKRVAIKVLAPGLAGDELFRARFVRESQIVANLEHPARDSGVRRRGRGLAALPGDALRGRTRPAHAPA